MRRAVIVLMITGVLLWSSAVFGRRPPATRWDGDPDEYQAKAVHDETDYIAWDVYRSGRKKAGRLLPEPGLAGDGVSNPVNLIPGAFVPGQHQAGMILLRLSEMLVSGGRGRLLREVLFPGKKQRYSGEGR